MLQRLCNIYLITLFKYLFDILNILQKSGIINDKRRLNVALSRAKHKILLVGNSIYLNNYPTTHTLIKDILHENQVHILNLTLINCINIFLSTDNYDTNRCS